MNDFPDVIFITKGDSVSPFDTENDTEQDNPTWLTDYLEELKKRDFQRVNDPRILILMEIVAL